MNNSQRPGIRDECRVVMLGAGASFGANVPAPIPTMNAFLNAAESFDLIADYTSLWQLLDKLGYTGELISQNKVNLEEVYSELDDLPKGLGYRDAGEYFDHMVPGIAPVLPVRWLESLIVATIDHACTKAMEEVGHCSVHRAVMELLEPGDVVVSWTYDLLADMALEATDRWSPGMGYGFPGRDALMEARDHHLNIDPDVMLLKPHGSLNWSRSWERLGKHAEHGTTLGRPKQPEDWAIGSSVRSGHSCRVNVHPIELNYGRFYREMPPARFANEINQAVCRGDIETLLRSVQDVEAPAFIVPPTRLKFARAEDIPKELRWVWSGVREGLERASHITLVGYSLPSTDQHIKQLLRDGLARAETSKGRRVKGCIVNPDDATAEAIAQGVADVNWEHSALTFEDWVTRGFPCWE